MHARARAHTHTKSENNQQLFCYSSSAFSPLPDAESDSVAPVVSFLFGSEGAVSYESSLAS